MSSEDDTRAEATGDGTAAEADEDALTARVETFVARNFPQIAMHGGRAGVEAVDVDTGEVWIALGGACSGCGISPMTVQALQSRLVVEVPAITTVHTDTGDGMGYGVGGPDGDDGPDLRDVPF